MSEAPTALQANGVAVASAASAEKRAQAESVLSELFRLLEIPAKLEFKDAPDNGIAVAIHPEGEIPGLQAGKRSSLVDALQFLSNKIVNRPNTERRWISIGVGGFPEPRPPPAERPPKPAPVAAVPKNGGVAASNKPPPAKPVTRVEPDERSVELPPDARVEALGKMLAEKSAKLGRYYAVVTMPIEARASLVRGTDGVAGVTVRGEGEGRNRRVVFTPAKPVPMPKRALPVDDEDDVD
jgi:predicted RNA-binding protein Jag